MIVFRRRLRDRRLGLLRHLALERFLELLHGREADEALAGLGAREARGHAGVVADARQWVYRVPSSRSG